MQLTAAAVTPPAEHAARRPAGAADAAAADACVIRKEVKYETSFGASDSDRSHDDPDAAVRTMIRRWYLIVATRWRVHPDGGCASLFPVGSPLLMVGSVKSFGAPLTSRLP